MEFATTQSPVASEVFASVALFVISVIVLLILRHYLPLRTTPAYLLVPIFFALCLPASMVLLVPIDLASSAMVDDIDARGIWLERGPLRVCWRIAYWLTFCLTWFIIPILGEYSDSGYRDPQAKFRDSLRANAQYYAIVFGSGILGLLYVLWSYGGFSESLKSTVMALAYCWGLVLAIYLMGHGLVAIPRRLFRNADISGRLRRIQTQAPKVYDQMEDAQMNLDDLEMQVAELSKRSKTGTAKNFQDWIEELVDLTNIPESQLASTSGAVRGSGEYVRTKLPTVITEKYMADLTRQLIRAKHARSRYLNDWNRLLHDAVRTQAIIDSVASKRLDFGTPSPGSGFWDRHSLLTPYTRFLYHYYVLPYFNLAFGGLLALASVCIVWSEVVKGIFPVLSVIRYSVVHHNVGNKGQIGLAGQVIAALWMVYMCAAALISITEVKVWRGRALVRRNTAPESAFWYASQVARLSVPLTYNFMTFLGVVYKDTVFYDFLGQLINLTPLGKWFDYLFPALILVPVCFTIFGLYGKIQRALGFGGDVLDTLESDEFGANFGTGTWREGRDLIERELNGSSAAIRGGRRSHYTDSSSSSQSRAAPILTIRANSTPYPLPGNPTTPLATSPNTRPLANTSARRVGTASRQVTLASEDDDENFFEALGHRLKNTIDTMDKPKWLTDLSKPKWMGGDTNAGGAGAGAGSAGNGSENFSDIRRWFGGGAGGGWSSNSGGGGGRIRL
ncbi:LMBR1 domain-containing protein [Neurospora intermedia]|uniref:LMBR1 domain-containing protein n=1 Tax=Neurospora intermedia TaxID=5142 RepID=A0ABR3DKH3_NEUIN